MPLNTKEIFKRTIWRSVTTYGATGDGTTDDSDAINDAFADAAADGGGWVLFPEGTYRVADRLFTYGNVHIMGYGATLKMDSLASSATKYPFWGFGITAYGTSAGLVDTWTGSLHGLTIQATSSLHKNQTHAMLAVLAANMFVIKDVKIDVSLIGHASSSTPANYPDLITLQRQSGWINSGTAAITLGRIRGMETIGNDTRDTAEPKVTLDPDGTHADTPLWVTDCYLGDPETLPDIVHTDMMCVGNMFVHHPGQTALGKTPNDAPARFFSTYLGEFGSNVQIQNVIGDPVNVPLVEIINNRTSGNQNGLAVGGGKWALIGQAGVNPDPTQYSFGYNLTFKFSYLSDPTMKHTVHPQARN